MDNLEEMRRIRYEVEGVRSVWSADKERGGMRGREGSEEK